jgi:hypothetical protein
VRNLRPATLLHMVVSSLRHPLPLPWSLGLPFIRTRGHHMALHVSMRRGVACMGSMCRHGSMARETHCCASSAGADRALLVGHVLARRKWLARSLFPGIPWLGVPGRRPGVVIRSLCHHTLGRAPQGLPSLAPTLVSMWGPISWRRQGPHL